MTPISLEAQLAEQRMAHRALLALPVFITEHEAEIRDMMHARTVDGYPIFGDSGWRKSPYELKRDMMEEAADMANYQLMLWRRLATIL